jgi:hypothetical protein
MTPEIKNLISTCYCHLAAIEAHLTTRQDGKAKFRARELSENAKLLSSALFRAQRVSEEVR